MRFSRYIDAFGRDGRVIKDFCDNGTNIISNGGTVEKVTFVVCQQTGRASVGLKGDKMSEGRFYPYIFDAEVLRSAFSPVYMYVSLKSSYNEFYRLSVLGATLRLKRAARPLTAATCAKVQMTLRSAARAAALRTKGLLHLRDVAMNAGISAHYYDTVIYPTLALFKAPDVLLEERTERLARAMRKLHRYIYPTSVVKGRVVRRRKPSLMSIQLKIVELFSRWCNASKLELPLQLLHFD